MPGERRSVPRVDLPEPVRAKVKSALPARIMDISSQGAQLEVSAMLRPGVCCDLRISLDDGDVAVRAVVRRCRAMGYGLDEQDRRVLLYRAGVEFVDVAPEVMARLTSSFLFLQGPSEHQMSEDEETDLVVEQALVDSGGEPHRAPSARGPVKIRIRSDAIRAVVRKAGGEQG
jgi:hypothetical protein